METRLETVKESNDVIALIGNGKYQVVVLLVGQLVIFACSMQEFILNFVALDGGWECRINSTECIFNSTMQPSDNERCRMNQSQWTFIGKKSFSIVNEVRFKKGVQGIKKSAKMFWCYKLS